MMRDLKGPDLFIDALAAGRAASSAASCSAVMVGAGDDLPRYQAQVDPLGLAERVVFLPPMPARQAFALAGMIVVPSRAEAMPYIVLEALAAGKPMIATAVGGIPEIFGEGLAGAGRRRSPRSLAEQDGRGACRSPWPIRPIDAEPAAELSGRFGADVMAARIEAIYGAALEAPSGAPEPLQFCCRHKGFLAAFCYRSEPCSIGSRLN